MAKAKMLSEPEAIALALNISMVADGKFGKDQAAKALGKVRELFKAGRIEDSTFDNSIAWLGNHSAVRQWGEKMGFVKAAAADRDAKARTLDSLIAGANLENIE